MTVSSSQAEAVLRVFLPGNPSGSEVPGREAHIWYLDVGGELVVNKRAPAQPYKIPTPYMDHTVHYLNAKTHKKYSMKNTHSGCQQQHKQE